MLRAEQVNYNKRQKFEWKIFKACHVAIGERERVLRLSTVLSEWHVTYPRAKRNAM